jgi:hypothetical protein
MNESWNKIGVKRERERERNDDVMMMMMMDCLSAPVGGQTRFTRRVLRPQVAGREGYWRGDGISPT